MGLPQGLSQYLHHLYSGKIELVDLSNSLARAEAMKIFRPLLECVVWRPVHIGYHSEFEVDMDRIHSVQLWKESSFL